jgi:serine/threonine protein kinase
MQIIQHICECLADLHRAGYVHRDLKPANIIWLPSQNRWTLIDFGCAAQIGEEARTGFSLVYAAPEAVRAHFLEKCSSSQATAALDVWSVGVIAVELFSGKPPLQLFQTQDQVSLLMLTHDCLPCDAGRCFSSCKLIASIVLQLAAVFPLPKLHRLVYSTTGIGDQLEYSQCDK